MTILKRERETTIELVGGIGNQLFGFAAGLYLKTALGHKCKFYDGDVTKGFTNHGSSLRDFDIPLTFTNNGNAFKKLILAGVNRFNCDNPRRLAIWEKMLRMHSSKVVGFDAKLPDLSHGTYIRGYFQSYRYFEEIRSVSGNFKLALKAPSKWFKEMSEEINAKRPIVIHVRRGDYRQLSEDFGMLSEDYYVAALQSLDKVSSLNGQEIWIFSDEINSVRKEFLNPIFANAKYVDPPIGAKAAESLILMSAGSHNVISNSTFSWWAASLRDGGFTIAPNKWFKNMQDPQDLLPEAWIRVESAWLTS